jgi:hypothetical protein
VVWAAQPARAAASRAVASSFWRTVGSYRSI